MGVPVGKLSNGSITYQSMMPKAGANRPAARTLPMVTPFPVGKAGGTSGRSGGRPKNTSAAAKKGTFGSRMF